jgi:glutamyl-Q tRNA(Asp) synthetase
MTTTRFAPSPTGLLHLGHAYAALFAANRAGEKGRFLVRLEDIDQTRSKPEYEESIFTDLDWLGLSWEKPVLRQSDDLRYYQTGLDKLNQLGVLYPCFCTRREIQQEIMSAGQAPHGPDGPLYPGTCRQLNAAEREQRLTAGAPHALRLDVQRASSLVKAQLTWKDRIHGQFVVNPGIYGDVVLARKDIAVGYHLAVVMDDARQGVTLVTRGVDLLPATHLHRLLIELLELPVPEWEHHLLIVDEHGKRLAKRDNARSLKSMREHGWSAEQLRSKIGLE